MSEDVLDQKKVTSMAELEALASAPKKYPLPCGCAGPKTVSMCALHQSEMLTANARLMGVPDLRFRHRDFLDLASLAKTLHAIKLQLIANPNSSCTIKIIPGGFNESHTDRV